MINKKRLQTAFQLSILLAASNVAISQECGEAPTQPAMPDGATATMDELVATSKEVNDYIAEADVYLDCDDDFRQSIAYKELSSAEKRRVTDHARAILDERNDISDVFNAEVNVYKEAHPES